MKEEYVSQYRCELCGSVYSKPERAEKCEKSHRIPQQIMPAKYSAFRTRSGDYPHFIDIEMDDGKVVRYDFSEVTNDGNN